MEHLAIIIPGHDQRLQSQSCRRGTMVNGCRLVRAKFRHALFDQSRIPGAMNGTRRSMRTHFLSENSVMIHLCA